MITEATYAAARLLRHWDASCILPDVDMKRDLRTLARQLETDIGIRLDIDFARIHAAMSLIAGPS